MPFDAQRLAEVEQTAARFAARHIEPVAAECDHEAPAFPAEVFARGTEAGFDRFALPESAGGHGFAPVEFAALVAAIARTCAGHAAVFGVHAAVIAAIHEAAGEQRAPVLERILASNGPIGAAIPEPLFPAGFETDVRAGSDHAHVRGPAGLAINAAPGGFLVAFAVDENNAPLAFLARADQDGVRVGAPEPTLGLRAMPLAELSFDAFALAPADVIAAGDQARSFYRALLRRVSLAVSASAVGLLQAAHRQAVKYAAERYQGGMMIIDHPHLRTILGAMTAAQVGAEGALFRATDAADLATALGAKVAVTEAAVRVATDAVQILGGYGYMRDYGLEKRMRDAATLALLPISNPRAELLLAALDQERLG